jgi:hypothetical protein
MGYGPVSHGAAPVWLKYCVASRGLSVRVAQQSTKACPLHHWTHGAIHCPLRHDQLVGEPLMIALGMGFQEHLPGNIR